MSRIKKISDIPFDQIKDANLKYSCIPQYNNMKVTNGKELLSVLLTSERLHHDIKDWIIHGGREQIILRKWDNRMRPQDEFRVFVKNGKIRAACQYDRYGKYDELINNKDIIEKKMHDFFDTKLKPLMKIDDYAVDLGYMDGEMHLIEFSPLIRCTSARLFRWDANYEEMTEGEGKLTLRKEDYEFLSDFINDWEKAYNCQSNPYDNYFYKKNQIKNNNESYFSTMQKYLSYINPINIYNYFFTSEDNNESIEQKVNDKIKLNSTKIIFVASVLKDGFYWSKKYIRYDDNKNKLLGEGVLNGYIIQIDKNGFGWIVEKENKKCKGQIFEVDEDDFIDIEYYYGIDDEKMKEINVESNGKEIKAYAFVVKNLGKELINERGIIEVEEYELNMEKQYFNPMQHIINQQEKYLNMSLDFNVEDRW